MTHRRNLRLQLDIGQRCQPRNKIEDGIQLGRDQYGRSLRNQSKSSSKQRTREEKDIRQMPDSGPQSRLKDIQELVRRQEETKSAIDRQIKDLEDQVESASRGLIKVRNQHNDGAQPSYVLQKLQQILQTTKELRQQKQKIAWRLKIRKSRVTLLLQQSLSKINKEIQKVGQNKTKKQQQLSAASQQGKYSIKKLKQWYQGSLKRQKIEKLEQVEMEAKAILDGIKLKENIFQSLLCVHQNFQESEREKEDQDDKGEPVVNIDSPIIGSLPLLPSSPSPSPE